MSPLVTTIINIFTAVIHSSAHGKLARNASILETDGQLVTMSNYGSP